MDTSQNISDIMGSPLLMTAAALILLVSAVLFFGILSAIMQYHWRRYSFNDHVSRRVLVVYYVIGIPILFVVVGSGLAYLISL